jgi:hypothetical protein
MRKNEMTYAQATEKLKIADKVLIAAAPGVKDVKSLRAAAVAFGNALRAAKGAQRKELADTDKMLG